MADDKKETAESSGVSTGTASTGRGRGRGRGRRPAQAAATDDSGNGGTPPSTGTDTPSTGTGPPSTGHDLTGDEMQAMITKTAERMGMMKINAVMKRPNKGTLGRKIMLETNFFTLTIGMSKSSDYKLIVQRYQVDWTSKRKLNKDDNRELFWALVDQNPQVFKNKYAQIYDDSKCCYALEKLPLGNGERNFDLKDFKLSSDDRSSDYSVRMQYTGSHIVDMKESYGELNDRTMAPVQIVDVILSQWLRYPGNPESIKWYAHGKSIYTRPSNEPAPPLSMGREMWRGFHSAAKVGDDFTPLINVDITHTAFYKQCSVIEFLCELLNKSQDGRNARFHPHQITPETSLMDEWLRGLGRELKGLRIRTNYMGDGHERVFKFLQIADSPSNIKFTRNDGTELTVLDYFRSCNRPVTLPKLPCLSLGSKQRHIEIPMEFCALASMPQKVNNTRVTGEQTSRLIRNANRPAPQRKMDIMNMLKEAQGQQQKNPFMDAFDVTLDINMLQINGRHLPAPGLLLGNNKVIQPAEGGWRQTAHFHKTPDQPIKWVVAACCLAPRNDPQHQPSEDWINTQLREYCNQLPQWLGRYGVRMEACMTCLRVKSPDDVPSLFKNIQSDQFKQKGLNFVLVVMPDRIPDVYNLIKRGGDVEHGIITQCVLRKNVETSLRGRPGEPNATAFNMCLKINMKMGGVNNAIEADTIFGKFTNPSNSTLFLGVDVTHPGPFDKGPSIASIVGNIDIQASKWAASIKIQRNRREHVIYMTDQIRDRIMEFFRHSGKKPTRIIVFRDGVSEGEFVKVLREEMGSVLQACKALEDAYAPPITYIVVQKRHHTRFFCANEADQQGRAGNIPAGTVVDTAVVSPNYFDYYLCSHAGVLGTSRPAHYCVLHDDSNSTADELQMLSYKLCHVYGRCNRSVGIPAPVYLADKACTRARVHYDALYSRNTQEGRSSSSHGASDRESATREGGAASSRSDETLADCVRVHENVKKLAYFG